MCYRYFALRAIVLWAANVYIKIVGAFKLFPDPQSETVRLR
jgi:hypothetical protein